MSILSAMIDAELAKRAVEKAKEDAVSAEFQTAVSEIHKMIEPYIKEIAKLSMKGDYGRPVLQAAAQGCLGRDYRTSTGLCIAFGPNVTKRWIEVEVVPRDKEGKNYTKVRLRLSSHARGVTDIVKHEWSMMQDGLNYHQIIEFTLAELVKEIA